MNTPKQAIGEFGETLACQHLEQSGYTILTRNWHCKWGEIDIVASLPNLMVFVEVKTRRSNTLDDAFSLFTPRKRDRVVRTIYQYLAAHNLPDSQWRFDLIAIALPYRAKPLLQHMEDILDW